MSNVAKPIECAGVLTRELMDLYVERLFRKRSPEPPGPTVDIMALERAGIPYHMERPDLVLVSVEGWKRAEAAGAIHRQL